MMIPTIHLNGTSRDGLLEPLMDAIEALRVAEDAMNAAAPNGRDYYPQGADAFNHAVAEHLDRQRRIHAVRAELNTIAEAIT
jgi:hypothetical protein